MLSHATSLQRRPSRCGRHATPPSAPGRSTWHDDPGPSQPRAHYSRSHEPHGPHGQHHSPWSHHLEHAQSSSPAHLLTTELLLGIVPPAPQGSRAATSHLIRQSPKPSLQSKAPGSPAVASSLAWNPKTGAVVSQSRSPTKTPRTAKHRSTSKQEALSLKSFQRPGSRCCSGTPSVLGSCEGPHVPLPRIWPLETN